MPRRTPQTRPPRRVWGARLPTLPQDEKKPASAAQGGSDGLSQRHLGDMAEAAYLDALKRIPF